MATSLKDLITRHQVLLEGVKTSAAMDFTAVVPKLSTAIAEVLNALDVDTLSELSKTKLTQLLTQLKDAQHAVIVKAEVAQTKLLKDIAEYEAGFEAGTLAQAASAASKPYNVKKLAAGKAYKAALDNPMSSTGQMMDSFIKGWGDRQVDAVSKAVTRAWGEGRTVQQLMRDIRGTKALQYKDGLVEVSRRQAEAVARTAVQHVSQQAREAVWAENDDLVIAWQFVATLDGRTTSQCRSLDGKEFKVGEGPRPPVHPNCRSTSIPVLPKEFDFLDEGATRSSQGGYVAANKSYYSWLQDQPAEFQDQVLGKKRGAQFRSGELTAEKFDALNLGKTFQPLTLEELGQLESQLPAVGETYREVFPLNAGLNKGNLGQRKVIAEELKATFAGQKEYSQNHPSIEALRYYKGPGYQDMNHQLRNGVEPKQAAAIDAMIRDNASPDNFVVYRGFTPPKGFDFEAMSDFVFQDLGFVSTSFHPQIADNFIRDDRGVVFRILVKKGQPSVHVEKALSTAASARQEFELLLPRGTKFRFTGNKTIRGEDTPVYEVTIEDQE